MPQLVKIHQGRADNLAMQAGIELLQIVNLTSMIDVVSARDGGVGSARHGNEETIEVIEYDRRSLVVQLPKARLRLGHLVELTGRMTFENKVHIFKATGKIQKLIEDDVEVGPTVTIHLNQFDKDLWDRFIKVATGEQVRVERLFSEMKDDAA